MPTATQPEWEEPPPHVSGLSRAGLACEPRGTAALWRHVRTEVAKAPSQTGLSQPCVSSAAGDAAKPRHDEAAPGAAAGGAARGGEGLWLPPGCAKPSLAAAIVEKDCGTDWRNQHHRGRGRFASPGARGLLSHARPGFRSGAVPLNRCATWAGRKVLTARPGPGVSQHRRADGKAEAGVVAGLTN